MMKRTHATVTVGNTSTLVLAADIKRSHLLLINDSDEIMYIAFGQPAVANTGIRLNAAGGQFEMVDTVYQQAIYGICASGSKKLLVTSGK
jgi:hypothetical protein